MRRIFILFFLFSYSVAFAQTPQQIDNQYAFAKTYGYIKYFYPGDEATKIDWDKFAFYGAEKVDNCKNASELKSTLNELVVDLMPGVKILDQSEEYKFDEDLLKPKNLAGYDVVSWQHLGVGLVKDTRSLYQSLRTNRTTVYKTQFKGFGNASSQVNAKQFIGQTFELTGRAKLVDGSGDGHLWLRIDDLNNKPGFFDNMDSRPIKSKEWANFAIKGKIEDNAGNIYFGAFLTDLGTFWVDDIILKIDGKEVYSANFETEVVGSIPKSMAVGSPRSTDEQSKYAFIVNETENNKYLAISSPKNAEKVQTVNRKPFDKHAKFGEFIEKSIGNNLKVIVPLALYGNKDQTYPIVDATKTELLLNRINNSP